MKWGQMATGKIGGRPGQSKGGLGGKQNREAIVAEGVRNEA